jgi:hypothetical protein
MKKLTLGFFICLLLVMNVSAQIVSSGKVSVFVNNKPKPEFRQNQTTEPLTKTTIAQSPVVAGKYYALIIGISKYIDPEINELDKPVKDAQSFYTTLTSRYTFDTVNIKFLKNATMSDIVSVLDYFAKIVKPIDNFLIFYAGHGVWNASFRCTEK